MTSYKTLLNIEVVTICLLRIRTSTFSSPNIRNHLQLNVLSWVLVMFHNGSNPQSCSVRPRVWGNISIGVVKGRVLYLGNIYEFEFEQFIIQLL